MYLVDFHGVEIVTTIESLFAALEHQPEGEFIAITGPDAEKHDRFEVTAPTYKEISPGSWSCRTVQIARSDLEAFLVYARTRALENAVSALDLAEEPYAVVIERLDRAISAVAALSSKQGSPA